MAISTVATCMGFKARRVKTLNSGVNFCGNWDTVGRGGVFIFKVGMF